MVLIEAETKYISEKEKRKNTCINEVERFQEHMTELNAWAR